MFNRALFNITENIYTASIAERL